jgi:hypothetical protein
LKGLLSSFKDTSMKRDREAKEKDEPQPACGKNRGYLIFWCKSLGRLTKKKKKKTFNLGQPRNFKIFKDLQN